MLALQNLSDQIARTITNTTIRRLVEFNYGEEAPVPQLVAANVQSRGLGALVETLTRFAQAGLVVSEENLRRFIRDELALPEESPEAVAVVRAEKVAIPPRPKVREELWIALAGPAVNLLIAGGIALWFWQEKKLLPLSQLLQPTDANLWRHTGIHDHHR